MLLRVAGLFTVLGRSVSPGLPRQGRRQPRDAARRSAHDTHTSQSSATEQALSRDRIAARSAHVMLEPFRWCKGYVTILLKAQV
jgi:hypothetical protein